jgi:hypothetical protein
MRIVDFHIEFRRNNFFHFGGKAVAEIAVLVLAHTLR